MKVCTYISNFLASKGVRDAFGIPGGVILDFLYALEKNERIIPHLSYHEQCAVFSAGGYAQAGASLGVAYGTRGPGIMNMITSIADAYCDSIPIMVFTSHGYDLKAGKIRVMYNQEFNLEPIFSTITKYYTRIDDVKEVIAKVSEAYNKAATGRKGPVVIDIASWLWEKEIEEQDEIIDDSEDKDVDINEIVHIILDRIQASKRPVILAGDGIKQSGTTDSLKTFSVNNKIPVLTSRYAEDVMAESNNYYGYIGSHGIRSANFILSKADLILSLGNRLAFPVESESFRPLIESTNIIRIDIDQDEFEREVPGSENYVCNLENLMPILEGKIIHYNCVDEWVNLCDDLKFILKDYDLNKPIHIISDIMTRLRNDTVITSDVGNHELWISRAYICAGISNRIMYSKTFGALGCSVAKAIGAWYGSHKPVLCFVGDQGFQMNIQEIQEIAKSQLPITIVIINNQSSGMIRSAEKKRFHGVYLHTTKESGYSTVDLEKISAAYGIDYYSYERLSEEEKKFLFTAITKPSIVEVLIDEDADVSPNLRKGDACQNLFPYIDEELYSKLNSL